MTLAKTLREQASDHVRGCIGRLCDCGYNIKTEGLLEQAADRIEALEAALRECVQYHVKAAADCRAISAVNQDNDLGNDSLTAAIDHDIAAEDIGEIARAALAPEKDSAG